jgi:hypothetical protein
MVMSAPTSGSSSTTGEKEASRTATSNAPTQMPAQPTWRNRIMAFLPTRILPRFTWRNRIMAFLPTRTLPQNTWRNRIMNFLDSWASKLIVACVGDIYSEFIHQQTVCSWLRDASIRPICTASHGTRTPCSCHRRKNYCAARRNQ